MNTAPWLGGDLHRVIDKYSSHAPLQHRLAQSLGCCLVSLSIVTQNQSVATWLFRFRFILMLIPWTMSVAVFWVWWLDPAHVVTIPGMMLNSVLLAWTTLLPAWFFFFV